MALGDLGQSKTGTGLKLPSVYQTIIDIFDEVVGDLKASAEEKGLDASGNLIASIRFEPKILGEVFQFKLLLPDYYKWVDEGRKKGKFPPINAILDWMRSKGIVPRNTKGKRLKTTKNSLKSLAFVIARGIAKKGTIKRFGHNGSNFYKEVIPNEKDFVKSIIKRVAVAAKKDILVEIKAFK